MNINFNKLERVAMDRYEGAEYNACKEFFYQDFEDFIKWDPIITIKQAVYGSYGLGDESSIEENGMEKFVAMICGMLFMIEKGDVDPDHAAKTYSNILDFETGEYDDLFDQTDLDCIRKDIDAIKNYLADHPDIVERAVRERKKAQG